MTKTDPYSLRHQNQRAATNADQAEFLALKDGSTVVDAGVYDERVAGAMDDFDARDVSVEQLWHSEDLKFDAAVGRVHEEIERRVAAMGDAYPFAFKGGHLAHSGRPPRLYEFFLAICNAASITSGKYVGLPRIFERICTRIVAAYFGDHAHCIHTGFPRDKEVGPSFKAAMDHVAAMTGEWVWGPESDHPDDPVSGDAGCDFIVWPDTLDGRKIGQLFILGQCACGNDWETKFNDISIKRLGKWFNPLSSVDPVKTFTTPFHVTDALLKEASKDAGYIFDRARLVMVGARGIETELLDTFGTKIEQLVDLVIS